MAELLLELFSEEIPARMQARAEADLARLLEDALKAINLDFDDIKTFSTPRRITAVVTGLPLTQPDVSEEKRGPSTSAPEQAVAGFKRSLPDGTVIEEREEKKGTFYYAKIENKGGDSAELLASTLPSIIDNFPWPKSMRWGSGDAKWVRPLQSILCLLDGKLVSFSGSGNTTQGHRFLAGDSFAVTDFADYQAKLRKAKVVLDPTERRDIILKGAEKLAASKGLTLVADPALLAEVAGLVEWPVPMIGAFDKAFLEVPSEALISEMKHHQKYFATQNKDGSLSPHFIFVANIEGDADIIRAGNERVLGARLSDAKFFWDQDLKAKLEDLTPQLKNIVFHEKLGTVADKVARVGKLAANLAKYIPNCDAKLATRAAQLCKADLVSGMVGEFPDLQGTMGSYYAKAQGEDESVATAISEHYSPKGPNDDCPHDPVSIALAMADKIDTLTGFFAIDEKPTGSKDPFALRRAALGIIRLITENSLRLGLQKDLKFSDDLMAFFADRLKVQQKEKGVRHDLIEAVFAQGSEDDLVKILAQVSALQTFIESDDGANLLAAYKRATNIVRIEEKKDKASYTQAVNDAKLVETPEKTLFAALSKADDKIDGLLDGEDYHAAMQAIASLRAPLDAFFDDVVVNAEDENIRKNRLALLSLIRKACDKVADFSKIEG